MNRYKHSLRVFSLNLDKVFTHNESSKRDLDRICLAEQVSCSLRHLACLLEQLASHTYIIPFLRSLALIGSLFVRLSISPKRSCHVLLAQTMAKQRSLRTCDVSTLAITKVEV